MGELIVSENGDYKKYEELLLRRDQLLKEAGGIHTLYMQEFGDLLVELFEVNVECIKKRKMIAYCIGAVNHGQAIDVQELNRQIAYEMAVYEDQLKAMALDNKSAKDAKSSPSYKVERAKRIYRRLARLIHPDINPEAFKLEQVRELWDRIVKAYHLNDDDALSDLEVLVSRALKDNGDITVDVTVDDIDDRIRRVEDEINDILTNEPYTYKELIESEQKTTAKKQELKGQIEAEKKASAELSKILQEILTEGGVPIAWIQD